MKIKIKRTMAIVLLVCFLLSVTATAVSAYNENYDSTWGSVSIQNYNNAYNNQKDAGSAAGIAQGQADGQHDCQRCRQLIPEEYLNITNQQV
jgi:hypothetical protein